jgi:hypothetical protein
MPTVKDYIATIEGICGAQSEVIATFRNEKKEAAINSIFNRCVVKKSVSGFMFEVEFEGVIFRVFMSGRAVFRGIKNRKELNRILAAILQ